MTNSDSTNAAGNSIFDKVAGKAKEVVGSVLGDDSLVEEGELQQRKAATAKTAAELAVEAEQRQAQADLQGELVENRVEQQRVAAELAERSREQALETERATAEAAIERQAAQQAEVLERQREATDRQLDAQENNVVVDLVDGLDDAAAIEREAARATAEADALEAARISLEQR